MLSCGYGVYVSRTIYPLNPPCEHLSRQVTLSCGINIVTPCPFALREKMYVEFWNKAIHSIEDAICKQGR